MISLPSSFDHMAAASGPLKSLTKPGNKNLHCFSLCGHLPLLNLIPSKVAIDLRFQGIHIGVVSIHIDVFGVDYTGRPISNQRCSELTQCTPAALRRPLGLRLLLA